MFWVKCLIIHAVLFFVVFLAQKEIKMKSFSTSCLEKMSRYLHHSTSVVYIPLVAGKWEPRGAESDKTQMENMLRWHCRCLNHHGNKQWECKPKWSCSVSIRTEGQALLFSGWLASWFATNGCGWSRHPHWLTWSSLVSGWTASCPNCTCTGRRSSCVWCSWGRCLWAYWSPRSRGSKYTGSGTDSRHLGTKPGSCLPQIFPFPVGNRKQIRKYELNLLKSRTHSGNRMWAQPCGLTNIKPVVTKRNDSLHLIHYNFNIKHIQ